MSARTVKSFAWLWIAALLTATVGISVQQIYCYCQGKASVSLFDLSRGCLSGYPTDADDCCAQPVSPRPQHSCCETTGDTCGSPQHHGCMEKSTRFFQLKTEFVVDKQSEKTFDCPLWLKEMPMFRRYFRPAICESHPFYQALPPPSLSGRDISLRHQLFRC